MVVTLTPQPLRMARQHQKRSTVVIPNGKREQYLKIDPQKFTSKLSSERF